MTELLTVREVAAYLKTTRQQVRRMIQCGELRAVKVGREYRITLAALAEFLEEQARTPVNRANPRKDERLCGGFFAGLSAGLISFPSARNLLKWFHKINDNGKERAIPSQKERISAC